MKFIKLPKKWSGQNRSSRTGYYTYASFLFTGSYTYASFLFWKFCVSSTDTIKN